MNGPYFCFEHGIPYGSDGFMCPACEEEICRQHDETLEDKNDEPV